MKSKQAARVVKAVAVLAVAAGVLMGCQSKEQTTDTQSSTAQETTAEESEAAETAEELKSFKIGFVDSGSAFPNDILGIAIEKGLLEEQLKAAGYEVETVPFAGAGPAINEALVGEDIDAAITGDVPAVIGKVNGIDTTLIGAEIAINDSALVVKSDSDINSIQDLKGKKIATLKGSYMHRVLVDMLQDNGLTINDVEFVNQTSPDAAAGLLSGSVDAALLAQVQYAKLVTDGSGKAILSGSDSENYKGSHSILVRTQYLEENQEAATAFLKALLEANEYAKENRDETITILAKSGVSEDAIAFLHPDSIDFNILSGDDIIETHQKLVDFLLENELASAETDVTQWVDASYYEEAVK
ncbi:MAG: aliphatic sulfonate ABC transporter substrate-binding protein [Lachnospiraceae bacterium]